MTISFVMLPMENAIKNYPERHCFPNWHCSIKRNLKTYAEVQRRNGGCKSI